MNIFRRPFNINNNINKFFLHKRQFSSKFDNKKLDALNGIKRHLDVVNSNIRMVYIVGLVNIVISALF
jgi:hypothetical protein